MKKTHVFSGETWMDLVSRVFLILPVLFGCCVFFSLGTPVSGADGDSMRTGKKMASADKEYIIGPSDVLEIQVWREPNLSCTMPVRPDGKITMLLLNDVQAAGLTPMELKVKIETGLGRFVENPIVSVIVKEIGSKNIYILGQVVSSGQYSLRPGLRVLQALSLAGGLTEWADKGNVIILRLQDSKQTRIKFNYKKISKGKSLEENILLCPGDTIIVR